MKLTSVVTAECSLCGDFKPNYHSIYVGAKALLLHIQDSHPARFKELAQKGREAAKSRNGCMYYDDGSDSPVAGWNAATEEFRFCWTLNAFMKELMEKMVG